MLVMLTFFWGGGARDGGGGGGARGSLLKESQSGIRRLSFLLVVKCGV